MSITANLLFIGIIAIVARVRARVCSTTSRTLKRETDGELLVLLKDMRALWDQVKQRSHELLVIRHVPCLP